MSSLALKIGQTTIAWMLVSNCAYGSRDSITASKLTGKDDSFCPRVICAYPLGDGIRATKTVSTAKVRPTLIQDRLHPGCYINRFLGLLASEPCRLLPLGAFPWNITDLPDLQPQALLLIPCHTKQDTACIKYMRGMFGKASTKV